MYIAKINKCYRDVASGDPKVLLRNIYTRETLYRDHAWVSINNELKKILTNIRGNKSYKISFEANTHTYTSKSLEKKTLKNIRNIKILSRA